MSVCEPQHMLKKACLQFRALSSVECYVLLWKHCFNYIYNGQSISGKCNSYAQLGFYRYILSKGVKGINS